MSHPHLKKIIPIFLLGLMLSFFSGALCAQTPLQIHYINVEQGQSTLIIGPNGTTILFDGGYETKGTTEVVPYLQSIGIPSSQTLNYIIPSHHDTDHYVGLTELINYGYNAYHVYDNGSDKTNTYWVAFVDAVTNHTTAAAITTIPLGTVIDLGYGATATCVAANGSVIGTGAITGGTSDENDRSICLLIKYNDFDFLLNADMGGGADDSACTGRSTTQINMESPTVRAIMPAGVHPLLSQYGVEVAHVGHHGSESSTNADYMNILTPRVACISVGAGQGSNYYHPRIDVVEHVLLAGVSCITAPAALVLQTEEGSPTGATTSFAGNCVGDIVISTDGINSYTVSANGAVSQGPDERVAAGLPVTYNFEEYSATDNAPIIYNVYNQNTTMISTEIVWSTNETASSVVRYGTSSGSYTNTASNASLVLNHQIALSGLTYSTTYYYVVESTDATSHTTTSPEHSIQTTGAASNGVVFSEVYYDTIGVDGDEEWIELYNNSTATAAIGGWTITDNNGIGATYTIPASTTMAPNSYFTIAVKSAGFNNLYHYNADLYGAIPSLNNTGEAIILKNASAVVQDAIGWEGGASGGLPTGWGSTTLPNAATGSTIVRSDVTIDTNTYVDWTTASNNGNPQIQPVVGNTITVTSPNGGESWVIGTSHNITWTSTGTVGSLNIDYSTNNGTNWTSVATGEANDGSFSWTVPSIAPSTTCLVRIQEADADPTDASNAVFTISSSTPPVYGVLFSEVYYDTIGTDADEEWIELYNKTDAIINIGGWRIQDNNGTAAKWVTIPADTMIAPYSYLTIAAKSVGFRNIYGYEADIYYNSTNIALGNSGDALLLKDSSLNVIDTVAWEGGTTGGVPAGWGSTTLPYANTGYTLVRTDLTVDTDTYADWTTAANNGYPQTQRQYTLTIVAGDGGTTNPAPGAYTYDEGMKVNITGTASTGYRFGNWSGDASGTANPITIMMNGNKTVTANFIRQYTLTIAAGAGGATDPLPGTYTYDAGTTVNIQATASTGYRFGSWSGGASGSANPASVTMDGDKTVTANFIRQYTLTITAGEGGTTNPVPGTYTYDEGTSVNIQATALAGNLFGSWSGDASGSANPTSVTMDRDKTVTANFIHRYTLTIVAGTGGATDPVPGTYTYDEGTTVNIQATASTGYRFGSWSGGATGSANPVSITMDGDKTVTANFIHRYTLTIVAGAGGATDPVPGTYTYDAGTTVNIQGTASTGYRFGSWSGGVTGSANPVSITMDGDKTVTANFIRQYTLTIAAGAGGATDPVPGTYTYDTGTMVNIQATASTGYRFGSWSGGATGSANPASVTMDGDKTVTANFIRQYTLTVTAGEGGTTNPVPGTYTYDEGRVVDIRGVASAGYRFASWSGDASGSANPISVIIDRDKIVTANFIRGYTLTIVAGAGGTTMPAPGTYTPDIGASVSIQAIPFATYEFFSWSGNASGSTNPVKVVINGDMVVQANFTRVVQAPLGLTGEKLVNRSVSMIEYIARLRWQPNTANAGTISYRIYQIENGQTTAIANVGAGTYEYIVHGLQATKAYSFGVTAVNSQGWESDMVQVVVQ